MLPDAPSHRSSPVSPCPPKIRNRGKPSKDGASRGTTLVPSGRRRLGRLSSRLRRGPADATRRLASRLRGTNGLWFRSSEVSGHGSGCWLTPAPALSDPGNRGPASSSPVYANLSNDFTKTALPLSRNLPGSAERGLPSGRDPSPGEGF